MSETNKNALRGFIMCLFPLCWVIFVHHWLKMDGLGWFLTVADGFVLWFLLGLLISPTEKSSQRS